MAPPAPYAAAHTSLNGPGDARPTAMAIVEDEGLVGKLKDKVILITGCSSGIGVETARALHATGAHLFLTVRDVPKGEKVLQDILRNDKSGRGGKIELLRLELDSLTSVRAAAAEFLSRSKQLNVLINNAGERNQLCLAILEVGLTRSSWSTSSEYEGIHQQCW